MKTVEIAGNNYVLLEDAAEEMKVEPEVLKRYVNKGDIIGRRVGKNQYLILEKSLGEFLTKNKK